MEGMPSRAWLGETFIAILATVSILLHLILRYLLHTSSVADQAPLIITLLFGGVPLVLTLAKKALVG